MTVSIAIGAAIVAYLLGIGTRRAIEALAWRRHRRLMDMRSWDETVAAMRRMMREDENDA